MDSLTPSNMERSADASSGPQLEWHSYKGSYIGIQGTEVICVIDRMDGLPCEAFGLNLMRGCFTSVEAAQQVAAKMLLHREENQAPKPNADKAFFCALLKSLLAVMEPGTANTDQGTATTHAGGKE